MPDTDKLLIVVGDTRVGKTTLVHRFKTGEFLLANYTPTVGLDFSTVEEVESKIKFTIYEQPGNPRYQGVDRFNRYHAAILAFDLTDRASFEHLETDLARIRKQCPTVPIFLVGTKSDLSKPAVEKQEAEDFVQKNHLEKYCETSAKNNVGVRELFKAVADTVCAPAPAPESDSVVVPFVSASRKRSLFSPEFLRHHIGKILTGAVIFGGIAAFIVFTGGLALTLLPLVKGLIVAGAVLVGVISGVMVGICKDADKQAVVHRQNPPSKGETDTNTRRLIDIKLAGKSSPFLRRAEEGGSPPAAPSLDAERKKDSDTARPSPSATSSSRNPSPFG